MFARSLCRVAKTSTIAFRAPKAMPVSVRFMGAAAANSSDVVIPELVDTLEWILDSPPNVHQFDEPPVSPILYPSSIRNTYQIL